MAAALPSPFVPGRDVAFGRLDGEPPDDVGLRAGDHVALVRRASAEEGEIASVVGPDGLEWLQRVVPEVPAEGAPPARGAPRGRRLRVRGVVVGVLRKFRAA